MLCRGRQNGLRKRQCSSATIEVVNDSWREASIYQWHQLSERDPGILQALEWPYRSWSKDDEERVLLHGSSPHGLSKQAYLLQWVYKAATQPPAALEHMLLLGYKDEPSALFSVSAPHRQERKPESARRSVFQVRCTW